MSNSILSDTEIRRFQEQIKISEIGLKGQSNIRNARIAIIGAGGTGAAALQYLSAIGIGFFGIIDFDMVDESNIQRQSLYGGTDLGKLKTIITKQHLRDIFPLSQYEIINLKLTEENARNTLQSYDIVVDATNNPDTSKVIDLACGLLKKPMVFCYVTGNIIHLSVFHYMNGPSYQENLIKKDTSEGKIAIAHGFAGLFIASEVVKILTTSPQILSGKIITFDCFNYSLNIQ